MQKGSLFRPLVRKKERKEKDLRVKKEVERGGDSLNGVRGDESTRIRHRETNLGLHFARRVESPSDLGSPSEICARVSYSKKIVPTAMILLMSFTTRVEDVTAK